LFFFFRDFTFFIFFRAFVLCYPHSARFHWEQNNYNFPEKYVTNKLIKITFKLSSYHDVR
jgi:hypothetical protein